MRKTDQSSASKDPGHNLNTNKKKFNNKKTNESATKLKSVENSKKQLLGRMKGTVHIKGDLIEPIGEDWVTG